LARGTAKLDLNQEEGRMKLRLAVLIVGLLSVTGALRAQSYGQYYKWEITPFVGGEVGGSYPVGNSSATQADVDKVRVHNSMSFGTFIDRSFTENFQFEFMWNANRTQTAEHDTISGQFTNAYNTDIDQFHFGALYMFRSSDKKLRPYAAAGLGFSHFENSGMNANNTAFSYGVGGGVKYYATNHIGFRGDARFVPTYENSSPQQFCDQFGNCFTANQRNFLNRANFTGGLIIRF
jgi:opacity protein-like surface antigen